MARAPAALRLRRLFPSSGHPQDPYVDDGPGPRVLCMLTFADERALRAAIADTMFVRGLAGVPPDAAITADAMVRKCYPTDGDAGGHSLQAPFSYVVRYHRPAEDERAFVENYIATHPTLLAMLPNVRAVLCDFPIAWQDPNALPSAHYMLGNEVAFELRRTLQCCNGIADPPRTASPLSRASAVLRPQHALSDAPHAARLMLLTSRLRPAPAHATGCPSPA